MRIRRAPLSLLIFSQSDLLVYTIAFYRICVILCAFIIGAALFHRTTNMWTLKNLGDSFLMKQIGRRPIIIGTFHRPQYEQNIDGNYVVSYKAIFFNGLCQWRSTLQTYNTEK